MISAFATYKKCFWFALLLVCRVWYFLPLPLFFTFSYRIMSIAYLQLGLTKLHADILCIVAIEQTCTKSRWLVGFGRSVEVPMLNLPEK